MRLIGANSWNGTSGWAARIARLRVPFGYIIGIVYLVFSRPTFASLVAGSALAALGILIRGWASGHLRKSEALATSGPYAYTRNPLYLGSLLLVIGFAIAGRTPWLALLLLVAFFFFYLPTMAAEADWMEKIFGVSYREYAARVPLLLPRLTRPLARYIGAKTSGGGSGAGASFRWDLYRRNRESRALVGFLLAILVMLTKAYLHT